MNTCHTSIKDRYMIQCLKKNQNAPRPSEHPPFRGGGMSKRVGGIKGCKYKISSWDLNGFPDGNNIVAVAHILGVSDQHKNTTWFPPN